MKNNTTYQGLSKQTLPVHNYVLTIAGHDPSGGAGITSDIKTFHAHNLYGLSVCTAITVQNDMDFKTCIWTKPHIILSQIEMLFERFDIHCVKIGLVESWEVLLQILERLHQLNSNIKIVLDPIFQASAGYDFHTNEKQEVLDKIWNYCYIVTPNYDEIKNIYPEKSIEETIAYISAKTNLYLKGGHRTDKPGLDQLFYNKIVQLNIKPDHGNFSPKHGSGCVLSSAIASHLQLKFPIEEAAVLAKKYTERFLQSNKTLLGNHK